MDAQLDAEQKTYEADCKKYTELTLLGWPPALASAALRPGKYVLCTKIGMIIDFEKVDNLGNGWIGLCHIQIDQAFLPQTLPRFKIDSVIQIQFCDIHWVCELS